jgi:cyclophilin family peptidyl-prolyl cis-trans isomerase
MKFSIFFAAALAMPLPCFALAMDTPVQSKAESAKTEAPKTGTLKTETSPKSKSKKKSKAKTDTKAQAEPKTEAPQPVVPLSQFFPSWATVVPGITGNPDHQLCLDISTGGRVVIQLRPDLAPAHVERLKKLARDKFYDGHKFHRVIEGFMAQTGDPTGTGGGDSPLPDLKAEFNSLPHLRGVLSMARTDDPNSANSQFFIVFQPSLFLDNTYTAFGRVVSGMQFVDAIARGEPPENPSILMQASVCGDKRKEPKYPPPPVTAPQAPSVLPPAQ